MEEDQLQKLIQKYLSGECSQEEIQALEKWDASFEEHEDLIDTLSEDEKEKLKKKLLSSVFLKIDGIDYLNAIEANTKLNLLLSIKKFIAKRFTDTAPLLGLATVLALILGITIILYFYQPNTITNTVFKTFKNPDGQRSMIVLPDGSKVYLNAGSQIRFDKAFTQPERKVFLEGEAFFEVKRDVKRPFIVYTRHFITGVLGTSFNIKNYTADTKAQVAVSSGKVTVESRDITHQTSEKKEKFILYPNQRIIYNQTSHSLITDSVEVSEISAWKEGVLHLEDMNFEQLAKELERWYNVKITLSDEALKKCEFSASFASMSLSQVLDALRITTDFTFTLEERNVYIKGKGCK